jgi:uncharacterized membrane protein required for colicin V production
MSSQESEETRDLSRLFAPPSKSGVRWLVLQVALALFGWAAGWLMTVRLGLRLFSWFINSLPGDPQAAHTTNAMPFYLLTICLPAVASSVLAMLLGQWRAAKVRDYLGLLIGLIAGAIYVYVQLVYWQYGGFGGAGRP